MKMNRSLLFLFLVLFSYWNESISQNDKSTSPKTIPGSFIIHGDLTTEQIIFYTKSIEAADFEPYRLKDAPVELEFKNGFKLELISAKDLVMKNKNQSINPNTYNTDPPAAPNKYPVFEITKSGWILAEVQTLPKKN